MLATIREETKSIYFLIAASSVKSATLKHKDAVAERLRRVTRMSLYSRIRVSYRDHISSEAQVQILSTSTFVFEVPSLIFGLVFLPFKKLTPDSQPDKVLSLSVMSWQFRYHRLAMYHWGLHICFGTCGVHYLLPSHIKSLRHSSERHVISRHLAHQATAAGVTVNMNYIELNATKMQTRATRRMSS